MIKSSEPIVFFGSGPVAAKSLESLYKNFTIGAVITKPVPPHHHQEAPVAKFAQDRLLKTYYVRDKNDLISAFLRQEILNNTRLGVLVDFGIIVPKSVIDRFELGIINSHFSLLPELRGADPITFAILSGKKETGVSLMVLVPAMDEGPLLAQQSYKLEPNTTTPELTNDLIKLSNAMLSTFLPMYISGGLQPVEQDKTIAPTYSRKLTKSDGLIDWEKSAEQLEREIRAYSGWPKSHTTINNVSVIITGAHVVDITGRPGDITLVDKQLVVSCTTKSLLIDRLKPAGKSEMSGSDFLRGYPLRIH